MSDLYAVDSAGHLRPHLHWGQWQAWESTRRIIAILAGTQGGKTSFGPLWLWKEIHARGAGDYIVAAPTFPLLEVKLLPEFRALFEDVLALGRYVSSPVHKFVFSAFGGRRTYGTTDPTTVFFGHAQDPDSLESATAKAAWLDEAGAKKFQLGSFQALRRRLAIHIGRMLLTTTLYNLGWLKQQVYDKWRAGDPDIAVISFASIMNPAFPRSEYEAARRDLPRWKFDMYYRGRFARPAGLIYDAFDDSRHVIPRFAIPATWPRFLGLDFGGVNTAGLFLAEEPGTGRYVGYREYKAGGRTAAGHADALLAGEPMIPQCVGGSKSEGQRRDEFRAGGLPVRAPGFAEVEVGIDRVYGLFKAGRLFLFDDLVGVRDQLGSYSRVLDANGEPTTAIEDKSSYHFLDALRYIGGWIGGGASAGVF